MFRTRQRDIEEFTVKPQTRPHVDSSNPSSRRTVITRLVGTLVLGGAMFSAPGCEWDGWLIDPSVVGRWEHTPTVVPILDRIDIIERDTGEFADVTDILPEDLIPEPSDYRSGPGDLIQIDILEFLEGGAAVQYQRQIDTRGFIDVPQLGRLYIANLTREEIEEEVKRTIREADLLDDPLATVQFLARREQAFSIFGAIPGVGRYQIPSPDFRLLEAMTDAGGVSPTIPFVYIIRQVPLDQSVRTGFQLQGQDPGSNSTTTQGQPNQNQDEVIDLEQLIDELTDDEGGSPNPGYLGLGELGGDQPVANRNVAPTRLAMLEQDGQDPIVDLFDSDSPAPESTNTSAASNVSTQSAKWVFLDGQWRKVTRASSQNSSLPEGADPLSVGSINIQDLVTQRVIRVPIKPLLQGLAQYNIVVRPGDVISVPGPDQGFVYLGGPGIARGGVYALPQAGRLTLTKAVIAAGGLSAVGIPQRIDLTRMVGPDRQATVRLDLKAIFEGTQPDIFLKPDDTVNFGTNFWATPLAIIRGGFRMTYGFGFLLDRNFGNDVFGAPPTNFTNN